MNSRAKGIRGELGASKFLSSIGIPCQRAARNGVRDGEDLKLPEGFPFYIEVKNKKAIDIGTKALEDAIAQAEAARPAGKVPLVLWKKRGKWRLSFRTGANSGTPYTITLGQAHIATCLRSYFVVKGMEPPARLALPA